MKKIFLILTSTLISIFLIVYLTRYFEMESLKIIFNNFKIIDILSAILIYLTSFVFRTFRWRLLLSKYHNYKFFEIFKINIVGYASNNILPLRLGEIVRSQLIHNKYNLSRSFTLGSITIERFADLIVILLILAISSYLNFNNLKIFNPNIIIFFILITILIIFEYYNNYKTLKYVLKKTKNFKYHNHLINFFKAFINLDKKTLVKLFGFSLIIWLIEIAVLVYILNTIIPSNSLNISLFTVPLLNLGLLIPSAPGYIGVFQSGFIYAFSLLNIDSSNALSISILFHFIQYVPVTFLGLYYLPSFKINMYNILLKNKNE